jgi:hypothetical protein
MSTQPVPSAAQRRHWYVKSIGPVPVQVPGAAVSTSSSATVPEIVGSAVLTGAAALTVAVGADGAERRPASLTAVTTTRTREPTSSAVSV